MSRLNGCLELKPANLFPSRRLKKQSLGPIDLGVIPQADVLLAEGDVTSIGAAPGASARVEEEAEGSECHRLRILGKAVGHDAGKVNRLIGQIPEVVAQRRPFF